MSRMSKGKNAKSRWLIYPLVVLIYLGFFFGGKEIKSLIFLLAMLSALFVGRIWCGFICPLGLLQALLSWLRKKLHIPAFRVSQKTKSNLRPLKWLILVFCLAGIVFSFLQTGTYERSEHAFLQSDISIFEIILFGVLTGICFMDERAFCRYCPVGTAMGLANKVNKVRIRKNGAACTQCRACYECCPMDIRSIYLDRTNPDVTHPDCIYCMKCIRVCPEPDVLSLTILGKNMPASGSDEKKKSRIRNG